MKKVFSLSIIFCMVLQMLSISNMVKANYEDESTIGEITAFAELPVTEETVPTGTTITDLELPEEITATVRLDDIEEEQEIPVTWKAQPEYSMDIEGMYVFEPVIADYMVNIDLPQISIIVSQESMQKLSLDTTSVVVNDEQSLIDAIGNVETNGIVVIGSDISLETTLIISATKNFSLDLNGKALSSNTIAIEYKGSGTFTIMDSQGKDEGEIKGVGSGIKNIGEGTLHISGGKVSGIVEEIDFDSVNATSYGVYNYSTGNIVISNGEVKGTVTVTSSNDDQSDGYAYGIYNNSIGTLQINGGKVIGTVTVTVPGTGYGLGYGIYNNSTGNIVINNGEVKGYGQVIITKKVTDKVRGLGYGINNNSTGNIKVYGGKIVGTGKLDSKLYNKENCYPLYSYPSDNICAGDGYGIYNNDAGKVEMFDGEINGWDLFLRNGFGIYNSSSGKVEVSGGIINSDYYGIYNDCEYDDNYKVDKQGEVIVSGGVIGDEGDEFAYGIYNNGKAIVSGGTLRGIGASIRNINDLELTGGELISKGSYYGQSYGIENYGEVKMSGGKASGMGAGIRNYDVVFLSGGEVTANGIRSENGAKGILNESGGKLYINGGTVTGIGNESLNKIGYGIFNSGQVEMTNGEVKGISNSVTDSAGAYGIYNDERGTVIITGTSKVTGTGFENSYGIYNEKSAKIHLSGGEISSTGVGIFNADNGVIRITNGQLVVEGDEQAMGQTPNLFEGIQWVITGILKSTGQAEPITIDDLNTNEKVSNYNSLKFEPSSSYTINAISQAGGTITPSGSVEVTEGANQTFTITPNTNYVIEDVKVDETSQGSIPSYTFKDVKADHTIHVTFKYVPPTYTIHATTGAGGTITPSGSVEVTEGANQTFTITPNTNYVIEDVKVDGESKGTITSYTFEDVKENHTISVSFRNIGGSSSSGGGIVNNSSNITITSPPVDKPNDPTQGEIKVEATTDSAGKATILVKDNEITELLKKTWESAKQTGKEQNGIKVLINVVGSEKSPADVTVKLSKTVVNQLISNQVQTTQVVVENPNIKISMDLETLTEIGKQTTTDIDIHAQHLDNLNVFADVQKVIGDRPMFDLTITDQNGKSIEQFGSGRVLVTIPYTLGQNEKAENIHAFYVDQQNKLHWMNQSFYDQKEKVVRFSTNHFSIYGIGYRSTDHQFNDISTHWAKEEIESVISLGYLRGTSEKTFSPNMEMTRGMFVTVLGRMSNVDITKYKNSSFTDVNSDAYYMGYIEWARDIQLIEGIGNNKFVPDQSISREQMAVIIQKFIQANHYNLPIIDVKGTFTDESKISGYALESVKAMQKVGILKGKDNNLFDPQGVATRAEASVILRKLLDLSNGMDSKDN